jgi:hypothetical protein
MALLFLLAIFASPVLVSGLVPSNLTECLAVPNCTVANNPLYGVRNGTAMPPCLVKEALGGWSCYNAMDDTGECPAFATMDCRVLWSPTHIVNATPPMPVCRSKCDVAGEADEPFVVGVSPGVPPHAGIPLETCSVAFPSYVANAPFHGLDGIAKKMSWLVCGLILICNALAYFLCADNSYHGDDQRTPIR